MSSSSGNSRADNSARRPVLFIQRRVDEGPGAFAEVLGECGLAWRCARLHAGDVVPSALDDWSLLVVLGDALVSDAAGSDPALLDLVARAVRRDFPTIAIGSGAELVLSAGGVERSATGGLVGWHPVELTEAGKQDPALVGLPPTFAGFHWHRHDLGVSQDAVALAVSGSHGCDAFRVGQNVYGFGFHPEVTGWMVERWIEAYADAIAGRSDLVQALHRETAENADASRQRTRGLLRGLLPALGVVAPGMGPVVNRAVE